MSSSRTPYFTLLESLSGDYWFVLFLIFMMKTGQFLLLPYLAILLTQTTHASPDVIGLVVGIGPLAYGLTAPFGGYIIDRIGRRRVLIASLFVAGPIFIFFNAHPSVFYYGLMNLLVGLTRSGFDVAARSYKVNAMDPELKKFCFNLRFAVLNAGAGLGPVLGMIFLHKHFDALLFVMGSIYSLLALFILYRVKGVDDFEEALKPPHIFEVFRVMTLDKRLLSLVVASVLMWTCYAQLDSIFGVYLLRIFPDGAHVLMWTFVLNTMCCVFLQMPVAHLVRQFSEGEQISGGSFFYMLGFFLIPFCFHLWSLLVASFIIVLGEILLSPLIDLLVFKIAPKNMLGSYYGASSIGMLGVGFGPIVGGFFYENFSARALFFSCVLVFLCVGGLLQYSARERVYV